MVLLNTQSSMHSQPVTTRGVCCGWVMVHCHGGGVTQCTSGRVSGGFAKCVGVPNGRGAKALAGRSRVEPGDAVGGAGALPCTAVTAYTNPTQARRGDCRQPCIMCGGKDASMTAHASRQITAETAAASDAGRSFRSPSRYGRRWHKLAGPHPQTS